MTAFTKLLDSARRTERYWVSRLKFDVAAQLQDLQKVAGITQEKYAERVGVKAPQISRTLSGGSNPTLETIVKMGFALGYVPQVTFRPVKTAAPEVTVQDLNGIQVQLTRGVTTSNFQFDPPTVSFNISPWTVTSTNDAKFALAA